MKTLCYLALILAVLVSPIHAQTTPADDFTFTLVADVRVRGKWVELYSEEAIWPSGNYQWWFNPSNVQADLSPEEVQAAFQTAADRWSQMCNINFEYMGITSVLPESTINYRPDRINVWGFSLDYSLAGFAPTSVVGTGFIVDSDIVLSAKRGWDLELIKSIMTHEIGHGLGLGHSDVQSSIMSASPYHDFDYTSILRGDDAQACAALYGAAPDALANRTMNWAEVTFPLAFSAPTAPSAYTSMIRATPSSTLQGQGYVYRYYAVSNSYLGVKDGTTLLYIGPDGYLQEVGPLDDFKATIVAAGF